MDIRRMIDLTVLAKTDPGMKDLLDRAEEYFLLKQPPVTSYESRATAAEILRQQMKAAWGRA